MDTNALLTFASGSLGMAQPSVRIRSRFSPTLSFPLSGGGGAGESGSGILPSFSFAKLANLTVEVGTDPLWQPVYSPGGPPQNDGDLFPVVLAAGAALLYVGGKTAKYGLLAAAGYAVWKALEAARR